MTVERVPRIYNGFRGVDFRGEEINLVRSPDSQNMWKDYRETDSIRTRPGMKLIYDGIKDTVYGMYYFGDILIVHVGESLIKIENGAETQLREGMNRHRSTSFVHNAKLYIKDGRNYICYDGSEISDVIGYVPTTTIGRKPLGGGTQHQDVNMLSDFRRNTFLADGTSYDYYLDALNIDDDFYPVVYVNDELVLTSKYVVDHKKGMVRFITAPAAPLTDGQDNVVIEFKKSVAGHRERILGSTLSQVFDNRVFVSGNDEYPNTVWHCSLDDPSYFSDTDYYNEGVDQARVRGMVAGNNALWVFREPSDANTTVYYHTPTLDDDYGKIYPSSHSSITIGCVGRAVNFNDDIVFFSERGMEGISGDITTEQAAAHRSTLVDRKLISDNSYKDMLLEEWDGYLLVIMENRVFLADSRGKYANGDHTEYEWFYWELEKNVTSTCVHDGILYIGTTEGVYTLTDNESAVRSWWVTPKDKLGKPHKLKTTNKRGCVAEATGDVTLYAKTEDTDFEMITEANAITDYFVSRIKRKKFKDIQLKFYSDTRFSLESVTLECFIGGYIKR